MIRLFLTAVVSMITLIVLSGCSSLGIQSDQALKLLNDAATKGQQISQETLDKAAETIDLYCAVVPEDARHKLREAVNNRTAKGDITITCVGDK